MWSVLVAINKIEINAFPTRRMNAIQNAVSANQTRCDFRAAIYFNPYSALTAICLSAQNAQNIPSFVCAKMLTSCLRKQ